MPLPLVAASAGRALFAFLYATNTPLSDGPSIYLLPQHLDTDLHPAELRAPTAKLAEDPFTHDQMPALMDAYIEHSRDPMPACDDAAWTLAGLENPDDDPDPALLVDMGLYSHTLIGPDGGVSLIFLDGDYIDGCTASR
ncbi:hypothetical protein T492DRAFT_894058 [Pavlovales sp. CCMP2436]|nr:hypothetical protein T492DRAFT_894058 [Pavlovales sp. CCMP2436]